jgi:hypothetical protein
VGKLFSSSNNILNLNIHNDEQVKADPRAGLGGSIKIDDDADGWLKNNLDIDLNML